VARAPRHAPKERKSAGETPTVGDQLTDSSPPKPPWLGLLAGRLGIGEGRKQFQSPTASFRIEPLWGSGHGAEVA
jgi:hypothetical protein